MSSEIQTVRDNLLGVKEKIIEEHDKVAKLMSSLALSDDEKMLERWNNLFNYQNGLRFCMEEIGRKINFLEDLNDNEMEVCSNEIE